MLEICLLGTGGTMPSVSRKLSSCLLRYNGSSLLIDCGEGTQIAFKENGYTFKPVDIILLTHYHADHVSGIPGLLLSMGNEGRTEPLTVIGPKGLERVIGALRVIAPELPFEIRLLTVGNEEEHFSLCGYEITSFPVNHAVPCVSYRIEIPRAGLFDPEKAKANGVPLPCWSKLQKESSYEYEGKIYTRDMVMGADRKGLKVVYATDTRPVPQIARHAEGADLLIAEGMYPGEEKQGKACETKHMTFKEAAHIALEAGVSALWLTHYSPSLPDPENYLSEAQSIFPKAQCGKDGMKQDLLFSE